MKHSAKLLTQILKKAWCGSCVPAGGNVLGSLPATAFSTGDGVLDRRPRPQQTTTFSTGGGILDRRRRPQPPATASSTTGDGVLNQRRRRPQPPAAAESSTGGGVLNRRRHPRPAAWSDVHVRAWGAGRARGRAAAPSLTRSWASMSGGAWRAAR
jgi:hypothetical protein